MSQGERFFLLEPPPFQCIFIMPVVFIFSFITSSKIVRILQLQNSIYLCHCHSDRILPREDEISFLLQIDMSFAQFL